VSGCSKTDTPNQENKAANSLDAKVLASFKKLGEVINVQTNSTGDLKYSDLQFDVRKTDSLVSPYTGVLVFKREGANATFNWTCTFSYQEALWVHKLSECEIAYSVEAKNDPEKLGRLKKLSEFHVKIEQSNLEVSLDKYLRTQKQ